MIVTPVLITSLIIAISAQESSAISCRSPAIKKAFDIANGYPHGRPKLKGEEPWVVDHICALECGGIDSPKNMQYQQYTASKLKDLWERTPAGCAKTCNSSNSTPSRQVFNHCTSIVNGVQNGK